MSWEEAPHRATSRRPVAVAVALAAITMVALGVVVLRRGDPPSSLTVGPTEPTAEQPLDEDDAAFVPQRLGPVEVTDSATGSGDLLPGPGPDLTIVATDGNELLLVDTTTGDRRRVRVAPVVLDDAVAVIGADLVVRAGSDVVRVAEGQVRPLRIADDHLLVPTIADDAVWVYSGDTPYADGTATLLGLDGRVRDRVAMPAVAVPLTGTADRLVVETPAGIVAVDGAGGVVVARGTAVATDGDRLAWLDCDGSLTCALVIGAVDDPDGVRATFDAADLPGGFAGLPRGAFSPDGRWLALPRFRVDGRGGLDPVVISVLDTTTGAEAFRADGANFRGRATPLAWSPDSRWLLFVVDGAVRAWPAGGDEAISVATDLGAVEALAVR